MAKSLSKNAVFKSILNLFNVILPLLVTPVITRTFTENQFSYITKGETYNTLLMALASFGVYQYGLREISKVRDDRKKLQQTFTSLFLISTVSTIVVSALYFGALTIFYKANPAYYTCLILGFNIVINMFYVEWINEALENYDFIAVKTMIVKIIYSIAILIVLHSTDDFMLYLYLGVACNIANNLWSYFYIRKKIHFDFSDLKIKKYIKPMLFAVLLSNTGLLYTQCDRLFIDNFGSASDLSSYGIAQKAMGIINTLMLTIIQVTMPRLANNKGNDKESSYFSLLEKIMKVYFLILFPASIGLLCVSKQVMWIFGPKYVPWYPVMMGFAVYMLTLGVQGIISNQIIYLYKKEREDVRIFFICGIINVALNGLLLIFNKLTPANSIMVTATANILVILMEYRVVKAKLNLNINIFGLKNMKYLYYSILFLPITFLINKYVVNIIISCALDVIICGLIYLSILVSTKDSVFFYILNVGIRKFKNIVVLIRK